MNKLGVIVPYRNRKLHLSKFKKEISKYLNINNISFELIIVEQIDNKPFNRGKLLNIGFIEAEKIGCNYVVFHDVDMLPIDVDYSYSDKPIHLATNFTPIKEIFKTYFGGVTMFPIELFKKINGYPNDYWGWGFEDDTLFKRCINNKLKVKEYFIRHKSNNSYALKFYGKQSYIKIPNQIDYKKNIKILVSFNPTIFIDKNKDYDEYTILSIPGHDMTLSYNSFGRYKFEFWDFKKKIYAITSDIKPAHPTTILIEIDIENCLVKMVQDRETVGEIYYYKKLLNYSKQESFYIGNANPYRGTNFKEFYGYISKFLIWNDGKKIINLDLKNFKGDCVYDLSMKKLYKVYSCQKIKIAEGKYKKIEIPLRRNSLFKLLNHSENGFVDGKWINSETRLNQIKFYNHKDDLNGLSTLEYKLVKNENNHLQVIL
jgi:hypothetical protein